ncbi:MAG: hypothetical protein HYS13_13630 [Planctomycetia bacterium]|nr:hypothetical protein [Planctomycetia bacterium]
MSFLPASAVILREGPNGGRKSLPACHTPFRNKYGYGDRDYAARFGAKDASRIEFDGASVVALQFDSETKAAEAAAKDDAGFSVGWWDFHGAPGEQAAGIKSILGQCWTAW